MKKLFFSVRKPQEDEEIEILTEPETSSTLSSTLPAVEETPSTRLPDELRELTLPSSTVVSSTVITGHPECDAQTLNRPHEDDCRKFYVCQNGPDGPQYMEETCEGPMLYNPHTFSCDRVEVVYAARPECGK